MQKNIGRYDSLT